MREKEVLNRVPYGLCLLLSNLLILIACNDQSPLDDSMKSKGNSVSLEEDRDVQSAKKLSDVIGGISHTMTPHHETTVKTTISKEAMPFVGRYQTKIACSDKIVHCNNGKTDIILNLLADGTAHRTIIHLGQITHAENVQYSKDKWTYDPKNHEIVLERGNQVKYFFNTDHKDQLILNASKVISAKENQAFFKKGNPKPMHNYVLNKDKH